MTPAGLRQLQERLKRIKGPERSAAVVALQEARSHGDLSENAEYDIAKERLSQIDHHIGDLERALANAEVIDPRELDHSRIVFGATVELRDLATEERFTYQIVGIHEADISAQKISIESPIARALIGKEIGDEARVQTPKGVRELEILRISYVE